MILSMLGRLLRRHGEETGRWKRKLLRRQRKRGALKRKRKRNGQDKKGSAGDVSGIMIGDTMIKTA